MQGEFDLVFFALLLALSFGGVLILILTKTSPKKIKIWLFLSAYGLRIGALFFMTSIHAMNSLEPFLSIDDVNYHTYASELVRTWRAGQFTLESSVHYHNIGYLLVNAIVYYVFGINPMIMRLINIFVSSLSVAVLYEFAYKIWGEKIGAITGILSAIYPSFIIISIFQFKDVFIIFLSSLFFLFLYKFSQSLNTKDLAVLFISIGLVFLFRKPMALALSIIFFLMLLIQIKQKSLLIKAISFSLVFFMVIMILTNIQGYSVGTLSEYQELALNSLSQDSVLLTLAQRNMILAYSGSLILTLYGAVNFDFNNLIALWLLPSTLLNFLIIVPFGILGIIIASKKEFWNKIVIIFLIIVLFFNVFGLQGGNFRYWLQGLNIFFIFIAIGMDNFKKSFALLLLLYFISMVFFAAHFIIKVSPVQ